MRIRTGLMRCPITGDQVRFAFTHAAGAPPVPSLLTAPVEGPGSPRFLTLIPEIGWVSTDVSQSVRPTYNELANALGLDPVPTPPVPDDD